MSTYNGLQHTERVKVGAQYYPTADRMLLELSPNYREVIAAAPTARYAKPYFLSHYSHMGRTYICSGTIQLFNADSKPYMGILTRDTAPGDKNPYITSGKAWLPLDTSVEVGEFESQISLIGKYAYLITEGESWAVTDDLDGKTGIVIGVFISGWNFRPNGITWWDRFVKVDIDPSLSSLNSPVTVEPNTGDTCCFGDCIVTAYPIVETSARKSVLVRANAFSLNPLYDITRIEWNYTGATETITKPNGQTVTQPKTELYGPEQCQTILFDNFGTYPITLRVFLGKNGECNCGCGEASGCCIIKEFDVVVSPDASFICESTLGVVDAEYTYGIDYTYVDAAIATADKIEGITLGTGAEAFTAPITLSTANEGAIATATEDIITAANGSYQTVTVYYMPAQHNNDNARLLITVTGLVSNVTLVSAQLSINNGATVDVNFTVV